MKYARLNSGGVRLLIESTAELKARLSAGVMLPVPLHNQLVPAKWNVFTWVYLTTGKAFDNNTAHILQQHGPDAFHEMSQQLNNAGYPQVSLGGRESVARYVHRLVGGSVMQFLFPGFFGDSSPSARVKEPPMLLFKEVQANGQHSIAWKEVQIDHINFDILNAHISNLRMLTAYENMHLHKINGPKLKRGAELLVQWDRSKFPLEFGQREWNQSTHHGKPRLSKAKQVQADIDEDEQSMMH